VESENEVERYLIDSCEDFNNNNLYILSWRKYNILKYNILSKVSQHVIVIPLEGLTRSLPLVSSKIFGRNVCNHYAHLFFFVFAGYVFDIN
jgi:hypothetical protein